MNDGLEGFFLSRSYQVVGVGASYTRFQEKMRRLRSKFPIPKIFVVVVDAFEDSFWVIIAICSRSRPKGKSEKAHGECDSTEPGEPENNLRCLITGTFPVLKDTPVNERFFVGAVDEGKAGVNREVRRLRILLRSTGF